MAKHKDRIDRLEAVVRLIAAHRSAAQYPDSALLLKQAAERYGDDQSKAARRALQRDLEELVRDGRIEVVNSGTKPLRYRTMREAPDTPIWDYVRRATRELIVSALPLRRFDALWPQVFDIEGLGLCEDKLRIVNDSLRLQPAAIHENVLVDVLDSLARSLTLQIGYRNAGGRRSEPTLHPQGLLQRGPRLYLFALKNEELEPVRMYALHRITRSMVGPEHAREFPGFNLQTQIDHGAADFGEGDLVDLVLRVRGYVVELLRECPLAKEQRVDDESEDSPFEARVFARVNASGQLLRWLLGCGDNLEVVGPLDLRQAVAVQSAKTAALYPSSD